MVVLLEQHWDQVGDRLVGAELGGEEAVAVTPFTGRGLGGCSETLLEAGLTSGPEDSKDAESVSKPVTKTKIDCHSNKNSVPSCVRHLTFQITWGRITG